MFELEQDKIKMDNFKKYLAKPPNKRVNYLKLQYLNAFYLPIKSLLSLNQIELTQNIKVDYYILRDKILLNQISNIIFNRNKQQILKKCSIDYTNIKQNQI